jgi:hypothetical protein
MSNPIVGISDAFEFASVLTPATFTTLAGVTSIAISGDKVATEKTTTMATVNGVDTFIGSTQDPGTADVKGFFLPGDTTQVALEAIRLAGVAVPMKALYGTTNSCAFSGIVESFTPSWPLDKPATFDLKIKISGVKTYL